MNPLSHINESLSTAWDNLTEGWRQLREHAGAALTRFNPLKRHTDIETRHDSFLRQAPTWGLLAADLREDATEIRVRLEAPGLEAEQFDIHVEGETLWIRGEKTLQRESQDSRFFISECAYGAFERAIPLPAPVDDSATKASYRRGVLEIILPKTRSSQRQRINIQG